MYQPNFKFSEGAFKGRGIYDPVVKAALAARGISAQSAGVFGQDAQIAPTTVANNGIPAWMANFHDPDILKILFAPLRAKEVLGGGEAGERRVGNMAMATTSFAVVEHTGETSAYGDYNTNGSTGVNANFPYRQSFNYQTIVQYGELEAERVALANINLIGEKKEASTWVMNQFMNTTYFYGVSGLQNYGILNDPTLPAAIQPGPKASGSLAHGPWITSGITTATPNEIYTDILALFTQLVTQTQGNVDLDTESKLTLVMSANSQTAIKQANSFGITALKLIKDNFPNIRMVTAVQYNTSAGNLVQMIADEVQGQRTGYTAYNEKLRAFPLIPDLSSYRQKIAGGSWGAIIRQGFAFAQMLGV